MAKTAKPIWSPAPAEHDYTAAAAYLRLVASATQVEVLTALLSQAPTLSQKAKDLLRAARLPLLPVDDASVAKELRRVAKGTALSPVLLVRGGLAAGTALLIADGYHRVCATYHLDEDTDVPCRLAALPAIAV